MVAGNCLSISLCSRRLRWEQLEPTVGDANSSINNKPWYITPSALNQQALATRLEMIGGNSTAPFKGPIPS